MLVSLAEELDTSVSTLLGETIQEECLNKGDLKNISEKHFRGIILVNKLSPNDHGNKDSIYNTLNNK